jgi:hypothetical protein
LFVGGGGGLITSAASELVYKVAAAKMNADAVPLICRAILCNWLVCLAVWMSMRITSEAGRMIAIAWCLFAFIGSEAGGQFPLALLRPVLRRAGADSYMCRLRIPNGILKHWQFAGLADLAERYGGGYAHVTTRANLQIREIEPKNAVA